MGTSQEKIDGVYVGRLTEFYRFPEHRVFDLILSPAYMPLLPYTKVTRDNKDERVRKNGVKGN
jgi:hypothetical protein